MSNQNTHESLQNNEQKEQKVIVLSINDMPKMKDLFSCQESGAIFNFKPQQLLQSTSGTTGIHVTQSKSTNIQPVATSTPVQAATQYVIRAQQPSLKPQLIKQQASPQYLSLVVTPTSQEPPKLIPSQISIQNKTPTQVQIIKSNSSASVITPVFAKKTAPASQVLFNPQHKTFQVIHKTTASPVSSITAQKIPRPIHILPKPLNEEHQQKVTIIAAAAPQQILLKAKPSQFQSSSVAQKIIKSYQPIPALAPIQRKIAAAPISETSIDIGMELEVKKNDESDEELFDEDEFEEQKIELEEVSSQKSVGSIDDDYINVKRIIEGDEGLNNYVVTQSFSNNNNNNNNTSTHSTVEEKEESEKKMEHEEEEEDNVKKDKDFIEGDSKSENSEQQAEISSDSLLLCDEKIVSVTPEESPKDKSKDDNSSTPKPVNSAHNKASFESSKAFADVKKTLNLEIEKSNKEKIQLQIEVEEEVTADNDDDSLQSKSEISIIESESKRTSKRSRKSKLPTVMSNLGLPYKAPQAPATAAPNSNGRKRKSEKKVELELDFHDPLNKILWADGLGGLNNCNKLFGFDEFGLVEVITKKDAKAKLNRYDDKITDGSFTLRKIQNADDQFVCSVCSKMGTIRDFFSPECCSEACLAITKRKSFEYGHRDQQNEEQDAKKGIISSVDVPHVMYGGENVTLQQLQVYLLKQKIMKNRKQSDRSILKPVSTSSNSSDDRFSWASYLTPKSVPAPLELFKCSQYPSTINPFKAGMKLEAIDPHNQHLICLCTVEERLGHRIKLHFDGYPSSYDFWIDSSSKNLLPMEFCRTTKRELKIPPKWPNKNFDWSEYLDEHNCVGAQRQLFAHLQKKDDSCMLAIGMKLEVRRDENWYAGTIADIIGDRMLITFDGLYKNLECAWYDFNSSFLNPCDGHKELEEFDTFLPPSGVIDFDWDDYLKATKSKPVPASFFANQIIMPNKFEPGMKLEVVDKVNPQLIRPATILSRDDYKIQINFDGFDISYAYWLNYDSEDIYPINYCKQAGHPIEYPAGYNSNQDYKLCSIAGCRGIGNALHGDKFFHENDDNECPYKMKNWKKLLEESLPSRFDWKPLVKKIIKVPKVENGASEVMKVVTKSKRLARKTQSPPPTPSPPPPIIEEVVPEIKREPGKRGRKRKIQPPASPVEPVPEDDSESVRATKIKVVEHVIQNYGPQINYSFDLWTKHSQILDRVNVMEDDLSENPLKWNVNDVCTFLLKFCTEETTAKFYAQKIDGEALLGLCQRDLIDLMDIKVGPSIKIYNRILHLRQEVITKFIKH